MRAHATHNNNNNNNNWQLIVKNQFTERMRLTHLFGRLFNLLALFFAYPVHLLVPLKGIFVQ